MNGALRTREHLTIDEVERLIQAAKKNRYGHRDALMALRYTDDTIRKLRKKNGYEDDLSLMMIEKDQAAQTVLAVFPGC